jgi:opacity protein-like surface antigen
MLKKEMEEVTLRKLLLALVLGCILLGSGIVYADGRNSVAVAGGVAWPEDIDATWYVTAGFRFHLDDNWAVEPDFGYWNNDEAQRLCLARGCVVYGLSDLHVGGNLLYVGTAGDIGLYTGGGLAGHWRNRETTKDLSPPENSKDIDETQLGVQLIFGADIPIANSVDITAAVRNDWIFRDDDLDTSSVFKLYAGLRFYFH